MKRGKKALAVLSTAALLGTTPAAVALPFLTSSVAYAAGSATALVVPTISSSDQTDSLGTIDLFVPKGSLDSGTDNQVSLLLPSGFQFPDAVGTKGYFKATTDGSVQFSSDGTSWGNSTPSTVYATAMSGSPDKDNIFVYWEVDSSSLLKLKVFKANDTDPTVPNFGGFLPKQTDDWHIYLHLPNMSVQAPPSGPANVTLVAPSNSALPTGSVTVANVNTAGRVDVAATDVQSGSNQLKFTLTVSEEVAGSLRPGDSIKLKLPSGFAWTYEGDTPVAVFGDSPQFTVTKIDDQTLSLRTNTAFKKTSTASGYLIRNLTFEVTDETIAKPGDVTVQVSGTSSVDNTSLVVGHYGQVGFQVTAESTPTVIAGKDEQTIGDIIIKETVPGSFAPNRTVTLTLPDQARWEVPFKYSTSVTRELHDAGGSVQGVNNVSLGDGQGNVVAYTDTDRKTLKIYVGNTDTSGQTSPGEIDIRNMQIAVQPGYTGDIVVQVGGTEGITGNVTVAKAQAPVSISVDNAPNVIVGSGGQQIGTITLTENVAGGFGRTAHGETHNTVRLELPYGVQFDGTPTVNVTQGDLQITDVSTGLGSDNKGYLQFYVNGESTTPSIITIQGAKLKLDRTVPQGDIVLKVKGDSVAFTANAKFGDNAGDPNDAQKGSAAVQQWADNNGTAASTVIAHVSTPAQAGTNMATFTVGSTTYTVNGQQQTMDVAPYLKNDGRVMLPVRFVANALGVSDDSIIWNQNDKSVTIFKGGSVVKMTLGSNTLIVNGTAVQMDVAPELYNDGRVMLPIRWVGQALNANISWDQATQTVTVTTQQ